MDNLDYVTKKLASFCSPPQKNQYLRHYNIMVIKRFLTISLLIFVIQYLMISSLTFSFPPLPMYPPMGFAFMMFYLFGSNALLGLCLSGIIGYSLKDFSMISITLNLLADIGAGSLGAVLCSKVFSSDIKPFGNVKESVHFFITNAMVTCLISSIIRSVNVVLSVPHSIPIKRLFFNFLDLWLADLNAILVFSSLLLSWIWILVSRTKIDNTLMTMRDIIVLVTLIVTTVFFINEYHSIYIILLTTLLSFYWSNVYGYLMSTVTLFITSSLYLAYFVAHEAQFIEHFGFAGYTLVPAYLLLVIVATLYVGHRGLE